MLIYHEFSGQFRVLYTDNKIAVVYFCPSEDVDGYCSGGREQVEIFSRTRDSLSQTFIERISDILQSSCFSINDFVATPHTGTWLKDILAQC